MTAPFSTSPGGACDSCLGFWITRIPESVAPAAILWHRSSLVWHSCGTALLAPVSRPVLTSESVSTILPPQPRAAHVPHPDRRRQRPQCRLVGSPPRRQRLRDEDRR